MVSYLNWTVDHNTTRNPARVHTGSLDVDGHLDMVEMAAVEEKKQTLYALKKCIVVPHPSTTWYLWICYENAEPGDEFTIIS